MMGAAVTSRGEDTSLAERNAHTETMGAEPAETGATGTAGDCSRTVQQSGFAVLPVCEA
jgi:hypothetical protein